MSTAIKSTSRDRLYDIINTVVLLVLLLIVAYPLYFVIIASISDPKLVATGRVLLWPQNFSFKGYMEVINYSPIWTGYRNTLIYTTLFTLISVLVSLLAGYALARKPFPGKTAITAFLLFTMFFNGGLIPTYLLMREIGLYGNPAIIVLLGAVNVTNIIISRTFIRSSIPEELFEAASIDGCSHFSFFFRIVMPVSQALIAVLVLFAAVSLELLVQRDDLSEQGGAYAAADGAARSDRQPVRAQHCQQYGQYGRRRGGADLSRGVDAVRSHYRLDAADHVLLSVRAEVLRQGRHDRLGQRVEIREVIFI
ncbi:carbohydrate ABC transporter permease [Paenibacillus sp. 1P07SE]|uniref:carbohydrate ABC transporter permease n=1 Tax=Paenibacillus sp. 1P07SE TaxID=3132209 RepID=UPI0039A764E0